MDADKPKVLKLPLRFPTRRLSVEEIREAITHAREVNADTIEFSFGSIHALTITDVLPKSE